MLGVAGVNMANLKRHEKFGYPEVQSHHPFHSIISISNCYMYIRKRAHLCRLCRQQWQQTTCGAWMTYSQYSSTWWSDHESSTLVLRYTSLMTSWRSTCSLGNSPLCSLLWRWENAFLQCLVVCFNSIGLFVNQGKVLQNEMQSFTQF